MLPLTPNYYAALVEYYRLAALADCQASLPPQELPQLIQELSLAEQALAMSSGALSLATNPATMIDQDMGDLAMAAAAAAAAVSQNESSSSPMSVGVSTLPSPTIPLGLVSAVTRDDDDEQHGQPDTQFSLGTNKNVSDDADRLEHTDAAATVDSLIHQSASATPEEQSLSVPADDIGSVAGAPGAATSSAGMASSLLLKPFTGVPSQTAKPDSAAIVSMAGSQCLGNDGADACFSPLDMLIAALDPQKSQHLVTVATPQPAVSLDQAAAIANSGCSSAGLAGAESLGALWSSVQGASPGSYGRLPWNNVPSMPTAVDASRRASDAALLNAYQLGRPRDGGGDNSPAHVQFDRAARKGSYPPGIKRPFSDFDRLLSAADMYAAAAASTTDQATSSALSHAASAHIPAKHARHDSIIECSSGDGGYGDPAAFLSADAAAAAAAAMAAANISYSTGATYDSLNPAIASGGNSNGLSLDAGMSMMPGGPAMSEPHFGQGVQMGVNPSTGYHRHGHHHHSRSLSFTGSEHHSQILSSSLQAMGGNPMTCATSSAGGGYLYDTLTMDRCIADGPATSGCDGFMVSPHPIPSIPGVTVSPKEQPRRLSVPDLSPPAAADSNARAKDMPRRQKVRFSEDMYTPMWVRNNGQQKEGFCDTCVPGKWLQLKNSAFWYHKQFFHGISSVSGRPFVRPLQVRRFDADIVEGLCHQCRQWVPIANPKRRNSVLWFRHAHKCHVYHKPKHDSDADNDGSDTGSVSASAAAVAAYMSSPCTQMPTIAGVSMTPHLSDVSN
ncbi:hypothetical protein GGI20_001854 [Coemansia sp. BCRC 34301]|nr:hypothetical protein GGI20_001854 [Coemansia sp. BCRC 34301]